MSELNFPLGSYVYNITPGDYFNNTDVTDLTGLYRGITNVYVLSPRFNTSKVEKLYQTFYNCTNLNTVGYFDTSSVTSMYQTFYGCTNLYTIPQFNTSKVTTMYSMFYGCSNLYEIPYLDTSNVTTMYSMFENCSKLTTIPQLNTSKVSNMMNFCSGCTALREFPLLDTSNVTNMRYLVRDCKELDTIPQLNTSNVTDAQYMFEGCNGLKSVPLLDFGKVSQIGYLFGATSISRLTDLGGFKDLGKGALSISGTTSFFLSSCSNLTHESLMNVINNLYDRKTAGYRTLSLKFGSTNLAKLTDEEKAIATNKGWTLTT